MDLATVVGIVAGCFLVFLAIFLGGNFLVFVNIQGILIVLGGTIATTLIRFPLSRCLNVVGVVKKAFFHKLDSPQEIIDELIKLARQARQEGLLSLEDYKTDDHFLHQGIQLIVDGNEAEMVEEILATDIRYLKQRHKNGQDVLKSIGDAAPAFGMIGTLIGLVQMLANMENPQEIGPAMAVALLTTLYGALLANLVLLPIADKLALRSQQEQITKNLVLDAALGIERGLSGMMFRETLKIHLSPKDRQKIVQKASS